MKVLITILIASLVEVVPAANSFYYSAYAHPKQSFRKISIYDPRISKLAKSTSNDIIKDTRVQADSLKKMLKALNSQSDSAQILHRIIDSQICLSSLDEALDNIEEGTKLIEDSEPEIKQLIKFIKKFDDVTDTVTVIKSTADLLNLLEVLIPKLAPTKTQVCKASSPEAFQSLRNIAYLTDELSTNTNMKITFNGRQELQKSARIISAVTTFLTTLNKSFSELKHTCTPDMEYNAKAFEAIGEMMDNLANMLEVLGGFKDAQKIRGKHGFIKKLVKNIEKFGSMDLGSLDCSSAGSFKVAAQSMLDVAQLVEEIGIETLANELGLDLDFPH